MYDVCFLESPSPDSKATLHEYIEATYVDDECLMLSGSTPRMLDIAIEFVLQDLVDVFHEYGLNINWAPGKSECLLKYRGKNAQKHELSRTHEDNMRIKLLANASSSFLTVSTCYKHLGSQTTVDNNVVIDASARVSQASKA